MADETKTDETKPDAAKPDAAPAPAPEKIWVIDRPILGVEHALGATVRDSELPEKADRAWLQRQGVIREPGAPRILNEVVTITEQAAAPAPATTPAAGRRVR